MLRKVSKCGQDFVLFRPPPHDMKQKHKILMQIQIARKK